MKAGSILVLAATASLSCVWAQTAGSGSTGTTTAAQPAAQAPTTQTPAAAPATNNGNPPATATTTPVQTTAAAPVISSSFITGRVMMDDGSPLPAGVTVNANGRSVHAAADGSFGIVTTGQFTPYSCSAMASLPGYTSHAATGGDGKAICDVGIIVLHRITGDEGHVVSATALRAPKDAKKNFDKGTELLQANKLPQAANSFESAIAVYPQFADAWLGLGRVRVQMGFRDEARAAFQKAMDLDEKLAGPWQEFGYLACQQAQWSEAVRYLDRAIRLDPLDSIKAWYFDAVANFNLGHWDTAEKSVRAAMRLDPKHKFPREEYLLGLILKEKQDMTGSAEALRNYIRQWPAADDADSAREQLSKMNIASTR